MSARAGEEIPKKNESKPIESTTPLASGSEGQRRTGINWREVLGLSSSTVAETSYTQAKEQTQRKEAEVSPEALELAKDNFGELVYLLLKEPNFLNNTGVREIIGQLSPELGKLFGSLSKPPLSAEEVVRKIQQEIGRIFTGDDSLSEQEKRIREAHRQQVVIIGLAFQEYKMQAIINAYNISINEEKPELSTEEEQLTQEAKQKLRRPENVLVLDEEGRIIPQEPELIEEEYVEAYYRQMPVSILRRIFGKTEEVQRRKAAEEYQRYRKLIEEQEGKKPGERRLRIERKKETQPKRDSNHEFLLKELGLMSENTLKAADVVLPEIMAQIRAALTLRQEILTATGLSGKELFDALKNLSPELSRILSLDGLNPENLNERVNQIIEEKRKKNATEVQQELRKKERRSTISQLEIKERELDEQLKKIKEKETQERRTGEKTQPAEERLLPQTINDAIISVLNEYKEELVRVGLIQDNQTVESLLGRNLLVMIKVLEAKAKSYRRQREVIESQIKIRLEPLQRQLEYLRRQKAEAKKVTLTDERGLTRVEESNLAGINEEISILEKKIDDLWRSSGLDQINKNLFSTEDELAILQAIIESRIAIEGVNKTVGEWLELYLQRSSEGSPGSGTIQSPDVDIKSTKEEVETELFAVRALIDYYSENALSEREERILQTKYLEPDYVFTEEHLTAIASRNPELYDLLPKRKNGKIDIDKAKRVLLVLYQAFGDKFIYPDDPNAQEVRGIITILQAIEGLGGITSIEDFDEKIRELVNGYLLKKRSLGSKIEQKETKS